MSDDMKEHRLPVPGTVYKIPADTHADLDLQDDKEQVFYSRHTGRQHLYYRQRS